MLGLRGTVMPRLRRLFVLVYALVWVGTALSAQAHNASVTRSDIVLQGDVVIYRIAVAAHDLAVAIGIDPVLAAPIDRQDFDDRRASLAAYFENGLTIHSEKGACPLFSVTPDYRAMPDLLAAVVAFRCPAPPQRLTVGFDLFFNFDPAHRNLGNVVLGDRRFEFVFDATNRRFEFNTAAENPRKTPDDQSWWQRFASILTLGIDHVASSPDQILFILLILIARPRFRLAMVTVAAFALAHSLAMGLTRYGMVALPIRPMEIAIPATVAFVALQNLVGRGMDRRWIVALAFGLIHGLGFYPAMAKLDFGNAEPLTFVIGFNIGVWLALIPVAVVTWALLNRWSERSWYRNFIRGSSLLILIVAGYWIVGRGVAS